MPLLNITGSTIVSVFALLVSLTLAANLSWRNLISNLQDSILNFSYYLSKLSKDGFKYLKEKIDERSKKKNRQDFLDQHKKKIEKIENETNHNVGVVEYATILLGLESLVLRIVSFRLIFS